MPRKAAAKTRKPAAKTPHNPPPSVTAAERRAYPFESAWIRRTYERDLEDIIALTDGLPPSMSDTDGELDVELEGAYLDGGGTDDYYLVLTRSSRDDNRMVARLRLASVLALARFAVIPEYPRKSRKEAAE
jgi:hypothetical protein